MEFSYIIPFKYSDDRLETLKKVLSNVRGFDCEIIVKVIKMQCQGTTCHMIVWEMSSFDSIQNSPY
jgi:hypothetical protein